MNQEVQTTGIWYALYEFRTVLWNSWKEDLGINCEEMIIELLNLVDAWSLEQKVKRGSSAVYSIVGYKADLVFVHLRRTLEELKNVQISLDETRFGKYTNLQYSYLSVVEQCTSTKRNSVSKAGIIEKNRPIVPKNKHFCFYPLNGKTDKLNWNMLYLDNDVKNSLISRKYIGGDTGIKSGKKKIDDWEWGVTLFASQSIVYKKLANKLRFGGENIGQDGLGRFFVGKRLDKSNLMEVLGIQKQFTDQHSKESRKVKTAAGIKEFFMNYPAANYMER